MNLRQRLADPHGYDKPLFPKPIAEMSNAEQWEELREVKRALCINVWQTTSQMEATKEREQALQNSISAYIEKEKPCTCTYQHARCAIGYDLEGKSMQAHIAMQQATPENKIERAKKFADACIAYQQHVEQKPFYQNAKAQQSKETQAQ